MSDKTEERDSQAPESEEKRTRPGVDLKQGLIQYDFIKSNSFRVVHVDGAFGGITPRGFIHMAIYNERGPIPKQITNRLKEDGSVGEEIFERRITREAIVREVEADLIFTKETAIVIRKWLDEKITQIEELNQQNGETNE